MQGVEQLARWDGGPGPLTARLTVPANCRGELTLLATGGPNGSDRLMLACVAPDRWRFLFLRNNRQVDASEEVSVDPGRPHELLISLGSMLPATGSQIFWERPYLLHLTGQVLVALDGKSVFARPEAFSPLPADGVRLNRQLLDHVAVADETDLSKCVLPLMARGVSREAAWRGYPGPVKLMLRPKRELVGERQPLLSTGRLGAGDLIYWRGGPQGSVRIGFQHAGVSAIESVPLPLRAGVQEIRISCDGLLPPDCDELIRHEPQVARIRGQLFVAVNGRVALALPAQFHPSRPADIVLGANTVEARPDRRYFDGSAASLEPLSADDIVLDSTRVVVRTGTPSADWLGWPGPLRLRVRFPTDRPGVAEPLLCTGVTGAADLLYVIYVDPSHVRLALDHWGVGGPMSEPIEIAPGGSQDIVVRFGSLFPPASGPLDQQLPLLSAWREEVRVTMNGRLMIAASARSHPSDPSNIMFGQNSVGASSCVSAFSGSLIQISTAAETLGDSEK